MVCPGYPDQPALRWSRKHEILEPKDFTKNDGVQPISSDKQPGHGNINEIHPIKIHIRDDRDGQSSSTSRFHPTYSRQMFSPVEDSFTGLGGEIFYSLTSPNTLVNRSSEEFVSFPDSNNTALLSSDEFTDQHSASSSYQDDVENEGHHETSFLNTSVASLDEKECANPSYWRSPSTCGLLEPETLDKSLNDSVSYLAPQIIDFQSELIGSYFNIVCPIISTFDSEHNAFRTYVSQKVQSSELIFYTIQSMAAAKLVWMMPQMKVRAFEYRSLAFEALHSYVAAASTWNTELIFVVLLLGISSPWFELTDLGTMHLAAMQEAVLFHKVNYLDDCLTIDFFTNALIYWEMISSVVDDSVASHDYSKIQHPQPQLLTKDQRPSPLSAPRIKPHPWTGVASHAQALFTRVARQIRRLRAFGSTPKRSLDNPKEFTEEVGALDNAIWACHLPLLHDITSIGDENTPAIHHLLLAEAYIFASLYQLYSVFGNVRRKRVKWMSEMTSMSQSKQGSWLEGQFNAWLSLLKRQDGIDRWLDFLGRSVIIRLEQIQTTSGTSCVQALLLLVVASSLSVEDDEEAQEMLRARRFVVDRLTFLSQCNLSFPISHVKTVVVEIFKRLDVGVNVFWMDVLQSLGTVTIIG